MVQFELDVNWPRAAWVGFGVVLAVALLFVAHFFVGTFVFALFFYYATRRFYRRIRRRVGPPSVAAAIALAGLALPAIVLLYYTVVVAVQQLGRFVEEADVQNGQLGPVFERIRPYTELSTVLEDPSALVPSAGGVEAISDVFGTVLTYVGVVGTGLLHLFVMFAIAFYLLRDGPRFARWATTFTDAYGVLDQYFREVDRSLDKVFYGNILNAIITGVLGAIAFTVLDMLAPPGIGVPYPALTGLLTGVASLIPVVGMKLVYVPMTLYLAVVTGLNGGEWWFVGLFALVAFVIVDTIPDLVVRPYVSGGTLHTGALMFAYIFGPLLWGWYGLFLGPILLVLVVHFARIVLPELIAGTPIQPYSVDPSNVLASAAAEGDSGAAPEAGADDEGEGAADGDSLDATDGDEE